jgi:hypothetical protein
MKSGMGIYIQKILKGEDVFHTFPLNSTIAGSALLMSGVAVSPEPTAFHIPAKVNL